MIQSAKPVFAIISLLAFAAPNVQALVATGPTRGVYDENTFTTNAVDVSATPLLTVGIFTAAVSTAFNANQGGVISFDGPGFGNNLSGPLTATFGAAQGKTLSIGYASNNNGLFNIQTTSANIAAISGASTTTTGNYLLPQNGTANPFVLTLSFGAITGGSAGEAVSQAGFTLLGRNGAAATTATVTATFSDATTSVATRAYSGADVTTNDTFFGFTAPMGASISNITVSFNAAQARGIDDLGFVTSVVPEPSTYAMALGGVGLLLIGRRFRSRRSLAG